MDKIKITKIVLLSPYYLFVTILFIAWFVFLSIVNRPSKKELEKRH